MGKVAAFITRPHSAGPQLVVFDHPLAGVQLPAGSLEPGEDPLDGGFREAWEETGIDGLALVGRLPDFAESRPGDDERRLASDVELAGRRHARGLRATVLGRRWRSARPGRRRVRLGARRVLCRRRRPPSLPLRVRPGNGIGVVGDDP